MEDEGVRMESAKDEVVWADGNGKEGAVRKENEAESGWERVASMGME